MHDRVVLFALQSLGPGTCKAGLSRFTSKDAALEDLLVNRYAPTPRPEWVNNELQRIAAAGTVPAEPPARPTIVIAAPIPATASSAAASATIITTTTAAATASVTPSDQKAASEKAATEKAASEKAASEKAPSEKAASEKAPSEKAASEKPPSEKAASEKAATEKATSANTATGEAASTTKAAEELAVAWRLVRVLRWQLDAADKQVRAKDEALQKAKTSLTELEVKTLESLDHVTTMYHELHAQVTDACLHQFTSADTRQPTGADTHQSSAQLPYSAQLPSSSQLPSSAQLSYSAQLPSRKRSQPTRATSRHSGVVVGFADNAEATKAIHAVWIGGVQPPPPHTWDSCLIDFPASETYRELIERELKQHASLLFQLAVTDFNSVFLQYDIYEVVATAASLIPTTTGSLTREATACCLVPYSSRDGFCIACKKRNPDLA